MADKDNKFILGDNSDGYRRSAPSDETIDFSLFEERPKKTAPQPAPERSAGQKKSRPAQPARTGSRPQQVQKRQQPTQQKKRPPTQQSVQRTSRPPQQKTQRRASGKVMGTADRAMSQNEKRRQHNEMRRKQRRRKQILSYAAIAAVVIAVMTALSLTVFFQINEISIKGTSPYPDEQVIAASGLSLGENVIRCNADGVSGKLSEALPYIGSAQVKRSLSGKVVITVKQTQGQYALLNGEQCVIIDSSGKVLENAAAEQAVNYTVILGASVADCVPGTPVALSDSAALSLVLQLGSAIGEAGISSVTSIDISDSDYIQAVYDGRLTLVVGGVDNLVRKLALAAKVIERENELDPLQYGKIDLTIDSKAYFRPDEDTSQPEDSSQEENSQVSEQ